MTWFVQYQKSGTDHLIRANTPEEAIESACRLLDEGCDVLGIGTGPLTDSIAKDQIARIYEIWVRAKAPALRRDLNLRLPEFRTA